MHFGLYASLAIAAVVTSAHKIDDDSHLLAQTEEEFMAELAQIENWEDLSDEEILA